MVELRDKKYILKSLFDRIQYILSEITKRWIISRRINQRLLYFKIESAAYWRFRNMRIPS